MIIKKDSSAIAPYLKDASNFPDGTASSVVIPDSVEELIQFLKSNTEPITISGARTGLTASGIPLSGTIISMEKLKELSGPDSMGKLVSGPFVTIKNIQSHLKGSGWFYPPNPTETWASLGGTLSTNASGSRSYKWGATRNYVEEVEIVLVDGRCAKVSRGQKISSDLDFNDGSKIRFPDINYTSPQCKNAAGFYVQPDMDWLDLFVGSDGTLCLFTKITLKTIPSPADFLSGILFLEDEEQCWNLVKEIRESKVQEISPCALEYFDSNSLKRLKPEFSNISPGAMAALYFEQDIQSMDDYDRYLEAWFEFLDNMRVPLEDSWFSQSDADLEKFQEFRHRLPLIINEENSREGRVKIGTDMAVTDLHFVDLMHFYRSVLKESGLPNVMFGHIGDNHLHINLLPDKSQMTTAKEVYEKFVDQVLAWRGTISAEHGVGKLKKEYYHEMVGDEALADLKTIKNCFDPDNLLGQGNLF
ncbi:MAG: FAD-binding oxidoreductase [Candidatus Nitronauta litoralis]|uniref:FAD-binding oxidoreductase n=1 Tax=Candidatus Nitronauta litoralis TaxID=2705533 RepID=A0A7T0G1V4_9BACT|nr:MAG: FAD-binding oxidoreductase [Candidatus Nitronauta litoralis]